MLKQTITISNPYHLSTKNKQLILRSKEHEQEYLRSIEDIGVLILDHPQVTFSLKLIQELAVNNVAVIFSDEKHMPSSMLFHLDTHYIQQERFTSQLNSSEPLRKQLWQQTVKAKIVNQAEVLRFHTEKVQPSNEFNQPWKAMMKMASDVKSGDSSHREAKAARFYWSKLFSEDFKRERFGDAPNNLLNYGYAIIRGAVARALVAAGLLPTMGIHHHNRYNSFCLADDIMEPYRPFIDRSVVELHHENGIDELTTEVKLHLQSALTMDCIMKENRSPLMVAMNHTANSLAQCFEGKRRNVLYPTLPQ